MCAWATKCCSACLCVCLCAAHFYLFISFVQKAQTRWFIFNTRSAVGGNCDWFCMRILLTHRHTHAQHTHMCTQLQSRLFVKLTEKRHRRCRRRRRRHPIRCRVFPFPSPQFWHTSHPPAVCRWGSKQQQTQRPKSACFPFPCVFQFRSLLLPVTSVCSPPLSLPLFLSLALSLSALSAAADCVCFIDFHSPTSFHSLLTILFSSLAARCKQKLQPVFRFSYYSAQTFYFISILFLFVYVVIIRFRVNK